MDLLSGFYRAAVAGELFVPVAPGTDTLRAAIAALPATPAVVYHLVLSAGTYNEIQLTPKVNISIEGVGPTTVIVTDGTRTDVDPVSGQRYVDMAEADKHGISGHTGFSVSNLTWRANDVKYVIHDDHNRRASLVYVHDAVLEIDNTFVVGTGGSDYQQSIYERVSFTTTGSHGMFWHNRVTETSPSSLTMANCTLTGTGVLYVSEQGPASGVRNPVVVTNCVTDDVTVDHGIYLNASSDMLPYAIMITQDGGTMPAFGFNATTRPDAAAHYTYVP